MFKSRKNMKKGAYQNCKEPERLALEMLEPKAELEVKNAELAEHKLQAVYKYCRKDVVCLFESILSNYELDTSTYSDLIYISYSESINDDIEEYELFLRVIGENGECYGNNSIYFKINVPFMTLHIIDILVQEPNSGIGSKMMIKLLEFANSKNIHTITGVLCLPDLNDHENRLIHFCEKFDFDIIDSPTNFHFPKIIRKTLEKT